MTTTFDDLPYDIKAKIFLELNLIDMIKARAVSRDWFTILNSAELFASLQKSSKVLNPEAIKQISQTHVQQFMEGKIPIVRGNLEAIQQYMQQHPEAEEYNSRSLSDLKTLGLVSSDYPMPHYIYEGSIFTDNFNIALAEGILSFEIEDNTQSVAKTKEAQLTKRDILRQFGQYQQDYMSNM